MNNETSRIQDEVAELTHALDPRRDMAHDTNDAQRYTETIADELRLLDKALREGPDSTALVELFGECEADEISTELDVLCLYLNNLALDFSVRRDTRGSEYGSMIEITRTTGGPGCWIRRDTGNGGTLEITAVWGSGRGFTLLWVEALTDWLDELAATH